MSDMIMNNTASAGEILRQALDIGEQLLINGAEISRVEDSIRRICVSYGASRVDVFSITSSIVVTMYGSACGSVTQTRRIQNMSYDLYRLELLNNLSRRICEQHLAPDEIKQQMDAILNARRYGFFQQLVIYALISASFSLFFGGSGQDAIFSALIGIILKFVQAGLSRMRINSFIVMLSCAVAGGFFAAFAVHLGLADSMDKINIGNVMLLIPGITLTNSIRDMFSGDTISGALRFLEAVLLSMTIAFGFTISGLFF